MAYNGKFLVNNEPLSPLTINGVGTFNAYSGNDQYRNRGGCTMVPDDGPTLPAGIGSLTGPGAASVLRRFHGQKMSGTQYGGTHRITVNGSRCIAMMGRLMM